MQKEFSPDLFRLSGYADDRIWSRRSRVVPRGLLQRLQTMPIHALVNSKCNPCKTHG